VLVAIPRATPGVLRAVVKALEPYKLPIKALPHLRDILDGRVTLNDVRRLEVADLLGRAPVGLDPQNVSHLVEGKRVLVTGAGGSIGSELSRQVAALRPSSLVLLERYENALWALERSLAGAKAGVDVYPIIGDVTDEGRIDEVLRERRPQVILHAAAHKHVPLMELNPCEAIKNNVKGTRIVGEAAVRHGVDRFVLISTDKAVNPSSVMGATKCVAELLTMRLAERASTCFVVVRFGNVMGSNGSVIPLFLEQIKNGGPVTITHPDMRRYFMLIPEAVQLVLQAAALGDNGAAYVLDMGDEIRVLDIARNLIRLSGFIPEREIPITFIGPRPGEKLSEELVASGETVEPSGIQGIRRVRASANPTCATLEQDVAELERLAELGGAGSVIQQLCALVPTFRPSAERDLDIAPSQPDLPASPAGAAATLIGEIRGFA
jgi:FlaA1/EpsC-like NDP-sugar epimerase